MSYTSEDLIKKLQDLETTDKNDLSEIINSKNFTDIITEGDLKGQSPLFWAMRILGPSYEALRNALATLPIDDLKKIVSSNAFTCFIPNGEFEGRSPLFWAMHIGDKSYYALRVALARLPEDALKKIVSSDAFKCVIPNGEFEGQSPLFWAMRTKGTFYDALINALARLPINDLQRIVSSPAFTCVIPNGEFEGQSPLFWAIAARSQSHEALRNALASLPIDVLKKIVSSNAFTSIISNGGFEGQSPLFWAITAGFQSHDALRNALTSLPIDALQRIVSSDAFTCVIPNGEFEGLSPLFWAMSKTGAFYVALINELARLPINDLQTIVSSNAFKCAIPNGKFKGQSPLFWAMRISGTSHDALRNALASLPIDDLQRIVSSDAFTCVIPNGEFEGLSPLFWAMSKTGAFYVALINELARLPINDLQTIVSSPAFTHIITEGIYKGESPLFWAMRTSGTPYDALINALAFLPIDTLEKIISSNAFKSAILETKYETQYKLSKKKILSFQKTTSLQKKYASSQIAIEALNQFLSSFMPSSQYNISVTTSSEYHVVIEAQDDFHLQFLNNICRALKLINQKAAVTTQTCHSPVKITNTFVLAELKRSTSFDFQQLPPIKEYNNVCQQILMLIRYFMGALSSSRWQWLAFNTLIRILPHSLLSLEARVINFPSGINRILTSLDLPDERIDLNLKQIEEWFERFLKKFIAFSNIGFTKDEVIKINTTIALTLEPNFKINHIDKTLALKESLRECFLSDSIKTINDEITSNIKQCQRTAFELNNQCYSIITSTFDTTKKEIFNQATFSACFDPLPHEALDSLQQEINEITTLREFQEKLADAKRGETKNSAKRVTESLEFILKIDAYSTHCLELLNRLIHDINTFHAQRISQTNNQCASISTQQQRILRKITITTEDEKTLEELNEQVIKVQGELKAIAFSFLKTQTTTLTYLKQRYDQLKKIPIGQHFKKLQEDWEALKDNAFFREIFRLPKATLSSAATAKRVQVELPKFEMPAPEGDYTQKLEALQAEHEKEMREKEQTRRNEKAQKANALELEKRQALKKPSSPPRLSPPPFAAMSMARVSVFPRSYPVVINEALSFEQGEHIKATCQSQTTNYIPYFTFLNEQLNALMAQNQIHHGPSLHLLSTYGVLLALLSLLGGVTLYKDLPEHTKGLIHLKTFASHLCHVEIVDVVEMCVLNPNPQYIPFFQKRLRLIWDTLNKAWDCATAQQYLYASQLLPLIGNYVRIEEAFSSVLNKQHLSVATFLKARKIMSPDEVIVQTKERMAMEVESRYNLKLQCLDMTPFVSLFQRLQAPKDFGALFTLSLFARELNRIHDYLFLMQHFSGELDLEKVSSINILKSAFLTPLTRFNYQEFANTLRHITELSVTEDFVDAALRMLSKS